MDQTPISELKKSGVKIIDYGRISRILWSRWYWITGCIILALTTAYLYLWYTPPVYSTSASLKFEDASSGMDILGQNNAYSLFKPNKLQSEGLVIQSHDVLYNAISSLDYKISYFLKGRVRISDVYPDTPFPIEIIRQDSLNFYSGIFDIEDKNNNNFLLSYRSGNKAVENTYKYGDTVKIKSLWFIVKGSKTGIRAKYSFKFNKAADFIGRVAGGISMKETAKGSNVLSLSQTDRNPVFAADVLNAILQEYINYDARQKRTSAAQTIDFINSQLSILAERVEQSGSSLQRFKRENEIITLDSKTQLSVGKFTQQSAQRDALKLEEIAINQLEEQVRNNRDQVGLNFNLEGSVGLLLSGLINQLNALIADKEKKAIQFNNNSETVQSIDRQITEIKRSIINNIRLLRERNRRTQSYIENQISQAKQEMNTLPAAEQDFIALQAKFDINQKVFQFLSEKKLDAQITQAAIVPGATIVDAAIPRLVPINPVPKRVYTMALLAGLLSGLGIILVVRLVNPFIYDTDTVEMNTSIPIIGIIRKYTGPDTDGQQILSVAKPKSVFAESVRSVRTNLSFLASEKNSKIICITSEISGEGKSFVSSNLASTLSLIDKKVVLLACDLRKSKLHKTFNSTNKKGISTYLSRQNILEEIIEKTPYEMLDFIASGPTPPNPSELLHSPRLQELLDELKGIYDYIIIDTAPVGLVSDSIAIIRKSDINVYVIRSGVSRFNSATIPGKLSTEYHLDNVVIVLNSFGDDPLHGIYYTTTYNGGNFSKYYYADYTGYAYSGYYTQDDPVIRWWQFWKKK